MVAVGAGTTATAVVATAVAATRAGTTVTTVVATAVAVERVGTTAATVVATIVAATGGPGLELPVGGGKNCLTLGRKLCPPCIFAMARLENERRWRGWEKEGF